MKNYEGKRVKIVFNTDSRRDPRRQRGHRGVISKVEGRFIHFTTDRGVELALHEDTVISVEVLMEGNAEIEGWE